MQHLPRAEGAEPRDFHLSRRGLGSMIFAGYAAAALAAEAEPIHTDEAGLHTATVSIPEASGPLPAYLARPQTPGRHPAVLVMSEVFGVHAYIQDVCRRFAKLGFVAVAPAFFFRAPGGETLPTLGMGDLDKIIAIVGTAHLEQVMGDVAATLAWLEAQPFVDSSRIVETGFCWGGGQSWMIASRFPALKACVAWYGPLAHPPAGKGEPGRPYPIDVAGQLKVPVLGLYGGQDKGISADDIAAMRSALAAAHIPDQIVVYPEAQHGFHADYRASYDPAAAADGWRRMLDFFRAHGVGPGAPA
jgi:carboxymethylenebutenolidase